MWHETELLMIDAMMLKKRRLKHACRRRIPAGSASSVFWPAKNEALEISELNRERINPLSPLINPRLSRCALVLGVFLLAFSGTFREVAYAQSAPHPFTALPKWQYGVFAAGGFAPGYQISNSYASYGGSVDTFTANAKLDFWNAGFVGGRILSALHGPGALRGCAETMIEIMPFWLARYPKQNLVFTQTQVNGVAIQPLSGPIDMHGASITPFLIRWNFQRHPETRILPWAQVGGGLLWTNHKFPTDLAVNTSVINFTPQVGFGLNTRFRPHQTLDLGLKAILISNAGLGDNNPGVASLQFSAGYSWWK